MLSLASRLDALNEQQLDSRNHQVVALLLSFQTRLLLTLLAALAIGLGLTPFTMTKRLVESRFSAYALLLAGTVAR
jgi:hypothetical protein